MTYSVLEYLYRDAGNNKAWGEVLLAGSLDEDGLALLRSSLDSQEYFVAEQFGLPSLRTELWRQCGGGYSDELDHGWHELVAVRPATEQDELRLEPWGTVETLLGAARNVGR